MRASTFDVEVSDDAETWTTVHSGTSSGATTDLEDYAFESTMARYVRIVGYGNSASAWNSITEVRVGLADGSVWPVIEAPSPYLAELEVSADSDPLDVGATTELQVAGVMSDGSDADLGDATVRFHSGDEAVATVSDDGVVTGLAEGWVDLSAVVETADRRLAYGTLRLPVDDPNTMTAPSIGDAYVRGGDFAADNYGSSSTLTVKLDNAPAQNYARESYLDFQLEPVAADVEKATLYLYAAVQDTRGTEATLHAHAVDGDWVEESITWNTKPPMGAEVGSADVDGPAHQWRELDVTDYVRERLAAGGRVSLGLRQTDPAGIGLAVQVRSREDAQFGPYIRVDLAR